MEVLNITPEYGLTVTYEFKNDVHETMMGVDYVNARWLYPVAKYNFQGALFSQSVYEYLRDFFLFVEGGEDTFLFQDPLNDYATFEPSSTEYGMEVQGILIDLGNGVFLLGKRWKIGSLFYTRPVQYPKEVTIYRNGNPLAVTVNNDGTVTGVVATDTWQGTFYTPVVFENDTCPIEVTGYNQASGEQWYAVPDLRLRESKSYSTLPSINLAPEINHYWQLSFPINSTFNILSKTDVFTSDSGYEQRDSLDSFKRELNFNYPMINYLEQQYILGLWYLTLGGWANIKFADLDTGIDSKFRFTENISFSTVCHPISTSAIFVDLEDVLYKADSITLKEDNPISRSTYCQTWIITRKDGTKEGFTNHDRNLSVFGTECRAAFGFSGTSSPRTAELNTDSTELTSVFVNITENDLITGKYDDASVVVYVYDWINSVIVSTQFRGFIGGYTVGFLPSRGKQFQIQVESIAEKLEVNVNAETSSECRHKFLSQGYGRCNLTPTANNTSNADLPQIKATVGGVNGLSNIVVTSPATDNWIGFKYGTIRFLTGALAETEVYIIDTIQPNQVILLYPLPIAPTVGDEVLLTRPCNKTVEACKNFGNIANYGGFPRLPGIDNLVSGADI